MKIVTTIEELKETKKEFSNKNIGFVPTMGALHQGHLSLMQRAKKENECLIVSIFVNPTQFLEGEDFTKYPRRDEADKEICQRVGVDILFMPKNLYFEDELQILAPSIKGFILEGYQRANHFNGVLQVVLKLFNLTTPKKAYFGKKDAQQLILIKDMTKKLFLDIEIVGCDIIRDNNGLALSSRNIYLSKEEREKALSISKALKEASNLIAKKEYNLKKINSTIEKTLEIDIEYIEFMNYNFKPLKEIELKNSIILIAGKTGTTRLIDNLWI